MIGVALRWLSNPMGALGLAALTAVAAYQGGKLVGRAEGAAEQRAEQAEANVAAANQIRERVRDALDEAGVDHSDDTIDRILRQLAAD